MNSRYNTFEMDVTHNQTTKISDFNVFEAYTRETLTINDSLEVVSYLNDYTEDIEISSEAESESETLSAIHISDYIGTELLNTTEKAIEAQLEYLRIRSELGRALKKEFTMELENGFESSVGKCAVSCCNSLCLLQ